MLKRQKVLLDILDKANRPLTHLELVKTAFLLGNETVLANEPSFYDFVPYKYGPFSFSLYREMSALSRDGYVVDREQTFRLADRMRDASKSRAKEIQASWKKAVDRTVGKYLSYSQDTLLREIYKRYPWFTLRSELPHLATEVPEAPLAPIRVYTIGYEGKSVDCFFNELLTAGICVILDVRANPVSRKYGFAKKSMSEIAMKLSVDYSHIPTLGISSEERSSLNDYASYQKLLDRYDAEMLPHRTDDILKLIELIRAKPSALLCMERDVTCCHRGRLANAAARISGLTITHL